jgi:hypothetical protein
LVRELIMHWQQDLFNEFLGSNEEHQSIQNLELGALNLRESTREKYEAGKISKSQLLEALQFDSALKALDNLNS